MVGRMQQKMLENKQKKVLTLRKTFLMCFSLSLIGSSFRFDSRPVSHILYPISILFPVSIKLWSMLILSLLQ